MLHRSRVVVVGLLAVVACDDGGGEPWSPPATYRYVVSELSVPRAVTDATAFGLDVDGEANDGNDGIDNALGRTLVMLSDLVDGIDVAAATDAAIDRGEILLLARLGASDPIAPGRGALAFEVGAEPMPAACASPDDGACRRHLAGDASFTLLGGIAPGTSLDGDVLADTSFAGDGGAYLLPMAVTVGSPVVRLPVIQGKSEVVVSAEGLMTGKLAGAIRQADLEGILYPALPVAFARIIEADCPAPRELPGCNCRAGSAGANAVVYFDTAPPRDCQVSVAEVVSNFNASLLSPDLDTDGDGQNDAVSIGVGYAAVPASIRP